MSETSINESDTKQMKQFDGCTTLQEVLILNKENSQKGLIFISSENKERFFSYKDLYNEALFALGQLQARGLKPGDELIFQMEDNYNFIISFWACLFGKLIPVPITIGKSEEHFLKFVRIFHQLNNPFILMEKKAIKGFEEYAGKTRALSDVLPMRDKILNIDELQGKDIYGELQPCCEEDIAFIQFSSGSTGAPKGVVLTHKNLLANTQAIVEGVKCTHDDSTLSWMPLTHDMGLIGFHLSPLRGGINQYFIQTSLFLFKPMLWLKKVSEFKTTILSSPNFGYKYLLKAHNNNKGQDWNLQHVRVIFNGAEPISCRVCDDFLKEMSQYGLKRNTMFPVYGLAEASLAVAFPPVEEGIKTVNIDRRYMGIGERIRYCEDENSVTYVLEGYSIKYCKVKICNDSNEVLEEDKIGYIKIKGDNVTKGFYNNPDETKKIIDAQGWLNTRDLGFIHQGKLVVTGRAKDIIFVNGVNYYSHDIEELLTELPDMELGKVAVCGTYNEKMQGEVILVFVVYRGDMEKFIQIIDEVRGFLLIKLGVAIDYVIPIIRMPKTTSGKLQRYKLAESYLQNEHEKKMMEIDQLRSIAKTNGDSVKKSKTELELLQIYQQIFETDDIGVEDNLIDIGGDSITITRLQEEINKRYPNKVNIANLFTYPSIRKLADFLEHQNCFLIPSGYIKDINKDVTRRKEKIELRSILNQETVSKLQHNLLANQFEMDQFLLAVYFYIIFQYTNNNKLIIYSGLRNDQAIKTACVLDKECKDFNEFTRLVVDSVMNCNDLKNLNTIKSSQKERSEHAIWVSFFSDNFYIEQTELADVFDFNLMIKQNKEETITLKTQFTTGNLSKEDGTGIFQSFVNMLMYLINKTY